MERLKEMDYTILEHIQNAPQGCLKFGEIVDKLLIEPFEVYQSLGKLGRQNLIRKGEEFASYSVTEEFNKMKIRKVRCPKCKTTRRVNNDTQKLAICENLACIKAKGHRTQFYVLSPSAQKKHITKYINLAD
ncbi:MAG: hypothetical protein U9O94_03200 [Nanoarchaeota archaeon]|nr:hypothetical protein [Nanoarchaeota archaeon]